MRMKSLDDISLSVKKASVITALSSGENIDKVIDSFFNLDESASDKEKEDFVYDMFNLAVTIFANDRDERSYNLLKFLNIKESTENNFRLILNKCNETMGLSLDVELYCKAWVNYIQSLLNEDLQEEIKILKEIVTDDFLLKVDRKTKLQILSSYLEYLIQIPNDLVEIKKINEILLGLINKN